MTWDGETGQWISVNWSTIGCFWISANLCICVGLTWSAELWSAEARLPSFLQQNLCLAYGILASFRGERGRDTYDIRFSQWFFAFYVNRYHSSTVISPCVFVCSARINRLALFCVAYRFSIIAICILSVLPLFLCLYVFYYLASLGWKTLRADIRLWIKWSRM